jgi:hypothetical protein
MEENKPTKINLITPPDKLHNRHPAFFLIYPSDDIKSQFQNLIENFQGTLNVYLYENSDSDPALDWLLDIIKYADYVILDIDNFEPIHTDLIAYLLGSSNVFWLTKGENYVYNTLSKNRIYNLDWFNGKIGELVETRKESV